MFVLISFREWLHSYPPRKGAFIFYLQSSSHLFQRVASFLHARSRARGWVGHLRFSSLSESGFIPTGISVRWTNWGFRLVLISFREWLHSYQTKDLFDVFRAEVFSSLSESGFIPTCWCPWISGIVIFNVLISFREWLHSY